MKVLKSLLWSMLSLVILLTGLLYFLTWTESGLQWLARQGMARLDNGSSIESINGRLGQAVEIHGLKLVVGEDRYDIAELRLAWSPRQLLAGRLRIDHLSANQILIRISDSTQNGQDEDEFNFPYPQLPFRIQLIEAVIQNLRIAGFTDEPLQAQQIRLSAHSDAERLHIQTLHLISREIDATLAGDVGLPAQVDSDLELQWAYVIDSGETLAASGRLAARGQPTNYRVNAEASIAGNDIPAGEWTLSGTGDLEHLSIEQLNGRTLDGTVGGGGVLTWSPALLWDVNLRVEHINPGRQWPEWPGQLSASLQISGEGAGKQQRLSMNANRLDGTLRGYRVAGQADIALDAAVLTIQRLQVTSGDNVISASGTLADQWDMNARIDAPALAALFPGWSGALRAAATIGGTAAQPRLDARLDGRAIAGPALSIQSLKGELALAASETATQSADIDMGGMRLGNQPVAKARLAFAGTWQQHRLKLTAADDEQYLDLQFTGGWERQRWQGTLERAGWQMPHTGQWSLHQPVPLTLGPQQVTVPDICLRQDRSELCIQASGNPREILETTARLARFPLGMLEEMSGTPLQFTSLVDARLAARLQAGRLESADLTINVDAGDIRYNDPSLPAESHLEAGTLRAGLDRGGIQATAQLDLAGSNHIDAKLELPGYRPQVTNWRDQVLAMKVTGDLGDLLIVQYLLEDVGHFQGALHVALLGTGTLGKPLIGGGAHLTDATLAIDRLGIELRQLDLDLQSRTDGLSLNGSAVSGAGGVELTGDLVFNDIASWEANVSLQGSRFEAMHQPEALILISPDLRASIKPFEIRLEGELHVPVARLEPEDLAAQTGRSGDVIIVDATTVAPPAERWQVYSQVHLSLGDDVEIDGLGLKGDLLGAIDLHDKPGQETRAQGTLSIDRGTYEAYGRKLDIERGRLLFSGGPVDNPELDFRASRRVRDVTAGVSVGGTLEIPELTLFSDPAMAESDIISYIAFGRPMSQVGEGSVDAASQGLIAGGNLLGGMVGTAVGLEELGVEEGETADDAAMVLGTYLSPQLYVRYRTGLYEAINEFHVIYDFTRNWGIRTISSVEKSSAEVRFSFER